jgi:hypothetical protein
MLRPDFTALAGWLSIKIIQHPTAKMWKNQICKCVIEHTVLHTKRNNQIAKSGEEEVTQLCKDNSPSPTEPKGF